MTAFHTIHWRLVSGILGVICLSLMVTLGILLKNSLSKESVRPASSPPPITGHQEGADCCFCKDKWIGYQCNCYFISNERKTWEESRHLCASQNTSLLHLQSREELSFIDSGDAFYWIGLSYSQEREAWLWENGSALSQDLFPLSHTLNPKNCIVYARKNILDEPCGRKNRYICKQQLI
ncbi:natural killer cells antigen CD94 isoform X2 [Tupaia chinensis]|uniref:natural killer cells antigen CD94 isoform X2 n=1 Tax=Tupaia chinensis TaxID=246437 RepID=UPI0003C8EE07|nr:natural killer cells antigen CD94 isoform X2 [Tupaia chinensis]